MEMFMVKEQPNEKQPKLRLKRNVLLKAKKYTYNFSGSQIKFKPVRCG